MGKSLMNRIINEKILYLKSCKENLKKLKNNGNKYPSSIEVYRALNLVGIAYSNIKKYKKSLKYRVKALNMVKEVRKDTPHVDLIFHLNNVGRVYYYLKNYKEALKYHEEAKKIVEKLFENNPNMDVAQTFGNMGNVYVKLKDYEKALKCYEKARRIGREFYKDKNITPAILMAKFSNSIGCMYYKLEKKEVALEFYKKALKVVVSMCKRSFDDETNDNLDVVLGNIRNILYALGRYGEASKYEMGIFKERLERLYPLKRNHSF
jgi:tetratricopeptide (TPR) repeat protein